VSAGARWTAGCLSVLAVGTRLAFVAQFLGRRLAYTHEVIDHVPGERFVMRTA
jgi:hypothetical protein